MKYILRLRARMQYAFSNFHEFWLISYQCIDKNIAIVKIYFFLHLDIF